MVDNVIEYVAPNQHGYAAHEFGERVALVPCALERAGLVVTEPLA